MENWIPNPPREFVKNALRKAFYPDYGFTLDNRSLTSYMVRNAKPAIWSADCLKPHGTLQNEFHFPHFLLARAMIRTCRIQSWCDFGTGCATLPLQVARLGINNVFGIDGSEAAMSQGKAQLPASNYSVADVCLPLEVLTVGNVPAQFDVVSALELIEHIPESKLPALFENIIRIKPKFVVFSIGLQPDPPYHVNLKSMSEWLEKILLLLSDFAYDDNLSTEIFDLTNRHIRFRNDYHTNHLRHDRNLVIFVKKAGNE